MTDNHIGCQFFTVFLLFVDQVSRAVATRLKAYRKAKKMSLDELSRRASISKGMLVEMEK
ncbi:helix-turn-helix domain-containing protein, partial [Klebsiella pneumoniae]|uniref:helix-turn-helix domain-containing protein n=1 Tax=Klebsiella pneumoniae TaxID=573 RepID=UPI00214AA0BA